MRTRPTSSLIELVYVDVGALKGNTTVLSLPNLGPMRAEKRKAVARGAGDFTWVGEFQGVGGFATLVVKNGNVTGFIQRGLDAYDLTPLGGGLHALVKIDPSKFPADHPHSPPRAPDVGGDTSGTSTPSGPSGTQADPITVDIVVAWTTSARIARGGDMAQFAQLAVDAANTAYANSNAGMILRLVGTIEVDYAETTFDQALYDVTGGAGAMAAVHALRDATGADLVSLMINNTTYCGLSWINSTAAYAFSAVYWGCAVGNHTFAHEIGHNVGARHDPYVDPATTPYAYGHGYVTPTLAWRTIMAYVNQCGSCPRVQYFSNPGVNYLSAPTGTSDLSDNARVHRERVGTVAAFRSPTSTSSPPPAPTASAATNIAMTSFTANWGSSSGATGYRLDVAADSLFTNYALQDYDAGNVLSQSIGGAVAGTTYYYRVRAYNAYGTSGNSNTISVTTLTDKAPAAPVASSATNVTSRSFSANWGNSTGAAGYRLDVATDNTFNVLLANYNNLDVGNLQTVKINRLDQGKTYYYRVRAYNNAGSSSSSNDIDVTTSPNTTKGKGHGKK